MHFTILKSAARPWGTHLIMDLKRRVCDVSARCAGRHPDKAGSEKKRKKKNHTHTQTQTQRDTQTQGRKSFKRGNNSREAAPLTLWINLRRPDDFVTLAVCQPAGHLGENQFSWNISPTCWIGVSPPRWDLLDRILISVHSSRLDFRCKFILERMHVGNCQ